MQHEMDAFMKHADTNNDGKISRAEWSRGFELYTRNLAEANKRVFLQARGQHPPREMILSTTVLTFFAAFCAVRFHTIVAMRRGL